MRIAKLWSIFVSAALVAGLAGIGGATPASAGTVSGAPACGTTVTISITLTADIGPCSGDGLIIGADKVSINLNRHTISGDGNYENGVQVGIRMTDRLLARVKGPGTIKAFNAGVAIEGGARNSVTGITATLNKSCNSDAVPTPDVCLNNNMGDGILMVSSITNQVRSNTVTFNSNPNVDNVNNGSSGGNGGISMIYGSSNNFVVGNTVTDNANTGIRVEAGGGVKNVIESNAILRNSGNGVNLHFSAADNRVVNNDIENNKLNGVLTFLGAARNAISGNVVKGSGLAGINVGSELNTVTNNAVIANATNGIFLTGGYAILQDDGSIGDFVRRGNVVQENAVRGNGRNGIVVGCAKDFVSSDPALASKCLRTTYDDAAGNPISLAENDRILMNAANGNGGPTAGTLTRDGSGNPTGTFDLLDQNEVPPCDSNTWSGNVASTAYPACTLTP